MYSWRGEGKAISMKCPKMRQISILYNGLGRHNKKCHNYACKCSTSLKNFFICGADQKHFIDIAGMVQAWEHSPPTDVARDRFSNSTQYMGWVCCWFSSLLREVFLQVLRFSPLLKNQHFQILIRSRFQWTNSHYVEVPLQIRIITIINNKLNPHIVSSSRIDPEPRQWEASALTTAPSLLYLWSAFDQHHR